MSKIFPIQTMSSHVWQYRDMLGTECLWYFLWPVNTSEQKLSILFPTHCALNKAKKKKTAHGTHLFFFFFSREVLLFETEQNNNFSDPPSNFCDTQAGNCCIRWQCSQYHTCSPFLIQLQKERQERFHTMDWLDHFCQDQTTFLWATHLLLRTHTILPSFHFQN